MSCTGVMNLAAHYPENTDTAPDLGATKGHIYDCPAHNAGPSGPKMYVACRGEENALNGTTRLHLDMADAVNMITWTIDPSRPSAVWHIFPRESKTDLRKFLIETYPDHGDEDPIQSQSFYLTDAHLRRLAEDHDVVPWTIEQRLGDLIVIPAGCPHQVRQCTSR